MKLLFLSLSFLLFSACTIKKPSVTEYRIITNNIILKNKINGCRNKSIKIAQAFSSASLMSTNMDYILENNKTFSYSQSQWKSTPNRAISLEVLKNIRESKLFKYTQNSKTRSKSDLLLETNIEDFTQYYNDDLSISYVKIVISFTLIDIKTNNVIAADTFKVKLDTVSNDAQGGTSALNVALSSVLEQMTQWIGSTCK